jgi:excisionase family DNA binding protein
MDAGDRRGVDRLTIQEAARQLGISEGAVRKRVTRKTLQHEKDDDGRVYVYLDAGG